MGTVHKHSRPYPVADCVADNLHGCVTAGGCFCSARGVAGNTAGGWDHSVHHPPQPRGPVWGRGCRFGCRYPRVPLRSGTGQHPFQAPFFLLFLQLFDLGTLRHAMHEAVKALQRLLPGSAVDLWFTLTIAEPG